MAGLVPGSYVIEVLPGGLGGGPGPCRATVICQSCFEWLNPDMWLAETGWDATNPAVLFEDLPLYDHDSDVRDEPETYLTYQPKG